MATTGVPRVNPSDDERLIREFILQLKLGSVSLQYFTDKFGTNPAERLPTAPAHCRLGVPDHRRRSREHQPRGLLQVDRLLHEFFLPEHRNARYA